MKKILLLVPLVFLSSCSIMTFSYTMIESAGDDSQINHVEKVVRGALERQGFSELKDSEPSQTICNVIEHHGVELKSEYRDEQWAPCSTYILDLGSQGGKLYVSIFTSDKKCIAKVRAEEAMKAVDFAKVINKELYNRLSEEGCYSITSWVGYDVPESLILRS